MPVLLFYSQAPSPLGYARDKRRRLTPAVLWRSVGVFVDNSIFRETLKGGDFVGQEPYEVSIVILHYNQSATLRLAVTSLENQDFSGPFEIIITDDGSDEHEFRAAREATSQSRLPMTLVQHKRMGYRAASARNNGIRVARGKLLIFLDGDMVPDLSLVSRHVQAHKAGGSLLLAGNRLWRDWDERLIRDRKSPIEATLEHLRLSKQTEMTRIRGLKEQARRETLISSSKPWKACFSCHLSILNSPLVRFDEQFVGWGMEDQEFAYRLCVIHGFTPLFNAGIIAYHIENPGVVGNIVRNKSHEAIVHYLKNCCTFYDRWPGIDLEDAFGRISRLELDEKTNRWVVLPHPPASCDLAAKVDLVRQWLKENQVP